MANKTIVRSKLQHYYDEDMDRPYNNGAPLVEEPDKTKSISELSQPELNRMIRRIGSERELQQMIKEMKRNAGEKDSYESPFKVDTVTPINQLYHHGVLGMKWGVRRYQNTDGTRTPKGKKRDRQADRRSNQSSSDKISRSRKTSDLSNAELKELNDRLQLESTYKRLTEGDMNKSKSWVKKSLSSAGEQALTEFSKGLMLGSAKLLVKEFSPEFAEAAFNVKDKKDKK